MKKVLTCLTFIVLLGTRVANPEALAGDCYKMSGSVQGCGINRNVLMLCGVSYPWVFNFSFCTMKAAYRSFPTCASGHSSGAWGKGNTFIFFCTFTATPVGTCCGGAITSMTAWDSYSTTNCGSGGCGVTTTKA